METSRGRMGWAGRLLVALTLIVLGCAATIWSLARFDKAAQFFGIAAVQQVPAAPAPQPVLTARPSSVAALPPGDLSRVGQIEQRLAQVERSTQMAAGAAGRADALVVAFAARRGVDRGVQLGFIENLLVDRFGAQHQRAVATVISASRNPVKLEDLNEEYAALEPELRGGGSAESWWARFRRGLGGLVEIRHADAPPTKPGTRYRRAAERLSNGDVEGAITETMRLPAAPAANSWINKARRYVIAHRALDELESAALMAGGPAR